MDKEVKFRIQNGWNNRSKVSGVPCDRRVPIRLKGKVHKAVDRPALTYGLEAAPLKKLEEKKLDGTEMKMLRWIVGGTRRDRIRNNYIREDSGSKTKMVRPFEEKSWRKSRRRISHGSGSTRKQKKRKT
ncbi:uncharacterized protein LOC134765806 [Penaeus indicus]|uniref:uncharacterized protein LOC134765806 n=1 Tax=Penaeus indicus TaxID=29960 RepID=UPI00300C19E3